MYKFITENMSGATVYCMLENVAQYRLEMQKASKCRKTRASTAKPRRQFPKLTAGMSTYAYITAYHAANMIGGLSMTAYDCPNIYQAPTMPDPDFIDEVWVAESEGD